VTTDATIRASVERSVRADRSHLAQLLENLIRNAVEHGGGDVTITVGEFEDGYSTAQGGAGGGARFEITGVESAE